MKLITGMHRSGTSMVARLFHAMGSPMGDEKKFYRPDKWNPDGYFEQPDIHAINFPLVNGPFWKFSYFWLPSEGTIIKRAQKLSQQIQKVGKKYQDSVVKENRFCLTLPAWKKYGTQVDKIIICLREPIQVAYSVKKRNWVTINYALKLWKEHNQRILKYARDIPHRFIHYNNVLKEDTCLREIRSILKFFDIEASNDQLLDLEKNHVKPGMNNNSMNQYEYPEEIKSLWEDLLSRYEKQSFEAN